MLHANIWSRPIECVTWLKMIIVVTQELIQLFVSFTSVNWRDNKLAHQICYLNGETISGSGELYKIQASLANRVRKLKDFNVQ